MGAADLDPAEALLLAERLAPAKMVDGEAHAAKSIMGVAEAAERPGFVFRIARLEREIIASRVMLEAIVDIAGGKEQRAEIVVYIAKLGIGSIAVGQRLGEPQRGDALLISSEQAHAGRDADPCPALHDAVRRRLCHLAEGLHGFL